MNVSYDMFAKAFLDKVTSYDFAVIDEDVLTDAIDGYMKRACAQFNRICLYDLAALDDNKRELDVDISDDDAEEIIDIVSEGMVVQWLKTYAYRSENLENVLNTADFTAYSPANLLLRVTEAYKAAQRDFRNMRVDYSYNHGDLGGLHL